MTWAELKAKHPACFATERGLDGEYPGWALLVDEVLTKYPEVRLFCVKEKFGGMRIHVNEPRDNGELIAIIGSVEKASYTTCAECGEPRQASTSGVCVACARRRKTAK